VVDDLARLAYESALRALDKQEQLLAELRARTGLLLAASSLAASFLGRPALENDAVVARLARVYWIAGVALAVEVTLLLVSVSDTLV
jgi:hypothetical protein